MDFQSEWTGHDNYLFFAKYAASSYNTNLWNQNVGNLIEKLPDNGTHFFFASFDTHTIQTYIQNVQMLILIYQHYQVKKKHIG